RRTTRVASARRAIDFELARAEHRARRRVRRRTRREDRALRARDLGTDDVERTTTEADRNDDVAGLDGRVEAHRENGSVRDRAIEDEEGDVRIAEHLSG